MYRFWFFRTENHLLLKIKAFTCVIGSTAECYAIILHIYNSISRIALLQTFEFFSSNWPPGKWTTPENWGPHFAADENELRLRHERKKRYERYVFKYRSVMYNLCSTHCWFRAFRQNFSPAGRTTYKLFKMASKAFAITTHLYFGSFWQKCKNPWQKLYSMFLLSLSLMTSCGPKIAPHKVSKSSIIQCCIYPGQWFDQWICVRKKNKYSTKYWVPQFMIDVFVPEVEISPQVRKYIQTEY